MKLRSWTLAGGLKQLINQLNTKLIYHSTVTEIAFAREYLLLFIKAQKD
jgi:hypothetical protein